MYTVFFIKSGQEVKINIPKQKPVHRGTRISIGTHTDIEIPTAGKVIVKLSSNDLELYEFEYSLKTVLGEFLRNGGTRWYQLNKSSNEKYVVQMEVIMEISEGEVKQVDENSLPDVIKLNRILLYLPKKDDESDI